MSVVLVR